MDFYDVIIIGAGPAGLLLGKELSKKHSVLILEKNKIGDTNKSWMTYYDRWEKEKFPKKLIENRFSEWYFQVYPNKKENKVLLKDNYICFNEHGFLKYLAKEINKKSSIIKEKTPFRKLKRKGNEVIINNKFRSNLLIDCTGIDSPFAKKLAKFTQYLSLYAYIGRFKKVPNYNYNTSFQDPKFGKTFYFGYTKVRPREAFMFVLNYTSKKVNTDNYKDNMKLALKEMNIAPHKIIESKQATYPTGIIQKRTLDNIFLFGDAGYFCPCFSGMGFNEILRQYEIAAKHLNKCIKKKRFSEKDLALPDEIAQDIDNEFFQLAGFTAPYMTIKDFQKWIDIINNFPQSSRKKIFRNELNNKALAKGLESILNSGLASNLIKYIHKNNIKFLVEIILKLDKDLLTEEIHNLIFKHHKIRIKDMCK